MTLVPAGVAVQLDQSCAILKQDEAHPLGNAFLDSHPDENLELLVINERPLLRGRGRQRLGGGFRRSTAETFPDPIRTPGLEGLEPVPHTVPAALDRPVSHLDPGMGLLEAGQTFGTVMHQI